MTSATCMVKTEVARNSELANYQILTYTFICSCSSNTYPR